MGAAVMWWVTKLIEPTSDYVTSSMQIDGSCDRQMLDHKFVSGRMANSDGIVKIVFVVMHSPEKNGAPGLLEAVNKALDLTGGKDTKLVGVITDGESANTGRQGGLWRLLAKNPSNFLVYCSAVGLSH